MTALNRIACILTFVSMMCVGPAKAADAPLPPAYRIVETIPLGAPDRWDFLYFDASSNRVYVSHRTKVDVVDLAKGKVVGSVSGIGQSHGVVTVPSLGRGYADDAANKSVIVFDLKTLARVATTPTDTDSDAVVFDPATNRVFVMNADGNSVTAIDASSDETLKTIPLAGAPESAVADTRGSLFVNIASTNEIVKFDARALAITARWPVPACRKPHGLALDTTTNRLFVSCVNARMLIVNAQNGAVIATLPIGKGTDSAAFDPAQKLAYSSNSDGTLSVITERGADEFVSLGDIRTAPGARTMALDPATGRIFLVTADVAKTEASDKPDHGPELEFVPGTLKLLVLEAK
jgi:YVTN family beta-propeller protein